MHDQHEQLGPPRAFVARMRERRRRHTHTPTERDGPARADGAEVRVESSTTWWAWLCGSASCVVEIGSAGGGHTRVGAGATRGDYIVVEGDRDSADATRRHLHLDGLDRAHVHCPAGDGATALLDLVGPLLTGCDLVRFDLTGTGAATLPQLLPIVEQRRPIVFLHGYHRCATLDQLLERLVGRGFVRLSLSHGLRSSCSHPSLAGSPTVLLVPAEQCRNLPRRQTRAATDTEPADDGHTPARLVG